MAKKKTAETGGEKKRRLSLGDIFHHNTFVLVFSFSVALISWFAMSITGNSDSTKTVYDVPIEVSLSTAAEEDGLHVFNMSYNAADIEISGSTLITNKLTAEDFQATVTLNPTSTKLTGNTLQKMTLPVRATKKSSMSDYAIVSVNPEEITVEYDRYKEITLPIENEIKYSADSGYVSGTVNFSEERVIVSGPESAVNKISRAAVSYSVENPLRADDSFTCPIRLFDQNNQEIADMAGLYLKLSVDTIDVTIPVLPKKTVTIRAATVNQPKGFSDSRITVEPAQIDIAGPADVLAGINEITLDTPINFADLDISQKNVFTLDIPLPAGVRNISSGGENAVSQATVSVNLNGYTKVSVTIPEESFDIVNLPAGKEVSYSARSLEVTVIGSEAQASKLTGDSISAQIDLTNFADRIGTVEAPVTLTFAGTGSDSCWFLGKYTMTVQISDENAVQALSPMQETVSDAVNAAPQE